VGSCEHGDESTGSVKCEEFIDYVKNCWLLGKNYATLVLVTGDALSRCRPLRHKVLVI
jgi:hypothetical protein